MTLPPITNCHIHLFTLSHIPNGYLPFGLMRALKQPYVRTPIMKLLEKGIFWKEGDVGERAARFARIGGLKSQEQMFDVVRNFYPGGSRFVVLPMDMAFMGKGAPDVSLPAQHDDLAKLTQKWPGAILPFAAVDPRRPDVLGELKRCTEELGFKGVKLYPPLGYAPSDKVLMDQIYPYCVDKNLPVMSHCSRGGVREKGLSDDWQARLAGPQAFEPVMSAFPELRICLAHFGGDKDWDEYLGRRKGRLDENADQFRKRNWLAQILDMLRSGDYPNLWTDISYTAFEYSQNIPALDVFLSEEKVLDRVLFGSDFYMTEVEGVSERRMSIELRHGIGEEKFARIARFNPCAYLDGAAPAP